MRTIEASIEHYKSHPPRLSYGGSEGEGFKVLAFEQYPHEEANKLFPPGCTVIWRGHFPDIKNGLPLEKYCVVSVCLDSWGNSMPKAIPLLPEMEGHALIASIYVDMFGRIFGCALGGATSYETRVLMAEGGDVAR